ncbi:ParB/Srx family N-terminal domain-containing protein [Streptomyces sp. NPDC005355]|uniref:ParB/Srx family N-terminal domain-containing protein n=1 Tax=Streptomyces sp. NPDC005355 TaxID=3157038 RepID=UPI0033BA0793
MTQILPAAEAAQLAEHEAVIERGLNTFVEVGNALAAIREQRLYRAQFGTFEDYCRARWSFGRRRANELIASAQVVGAIAPTDLPPLENEGQARELARVPEPERAAVWSATIERTDGKPTAAAVRETYEQRLPSKAKRRRPDGEERIGFYRVHPFLALFPWVDDDLFASIVDSIKAIGLLHPIVLTHDRKTIVDGRIRYRACEAAGVEPKFTVLGPHYDERMILDVIWSLNVVRSHASTVERTMQLVDLQLRAEDS